MRGGKHGADPQAVQRKETKSTQYIDFYHVQCTISCIMVGHENRRSFFCDERLFVRDGFEFQYVLQIFRYLCRMLTLR